jgi:hypothetical protein
MFVTLSRTDIPPCPVCGNPASRNFSFNIATSVPEHFNHSVGGYVNNERELKEQIKIRSQEESERTGIEHNFEYLSRSDMADSAAHGVTEEGLEQTARATYVAD